MINNKGVSSVIAIVLIVLITIAAVTILWQVIIPMVRQSSDVGFACEKARMDLELVSAKYKYLPAISASLEFQVKRGNKNADIDDLRIYVYDETGKKVLEYTLGDFSPNELPSSNNVRTFTQTSSDIKNANDESPLTDFSIAPVVNGEVCDKLEPINIEKS